MWVDQKRKFVVNALAKVLGIEPRQRALYLCVPKTPLDQGHRLRVLSGEEILDTAGLRLCIVLGDCQRLSAGLDSLRWLEKVATASRSSQRTRTAVSGVVAASRAPPRRGTPPWSTGGPSLR